MRLAALAVLTTTLASTNALAQTPPPSATTPAPTAPPTEPPALPGDGWYGWQTLAVDGLGVVAGFAALTMSRDWHVSAGHNPSDAAYLATGAYAFGMIGAPAVHFGHGRRQTGAADIVIRALTPPLVGLGGITVNCFSKNFRSCSQDGMIAGTAVGLAGVAFVDAVFLSDDKIRKSREDENWYGWQTLLADGAAAGGALYVVFSERSRHPDNPQNPLESGGLGFWLFGSVAAPIVHFAHGHVGKGFGDFGIRFVAPLVTTVPGMIGYCSVTGGMKFCAADGAIVGIGAGALASALFDATVLAREKGESSGKAMIVPTVVPVVGGAVMGVGGGF